jgi:hypothetical protein
MAALQAAEGFSRLASVARALDGVIHLRVVAEADELASLATRFGLVSLDRLEADATVAAAEPAGSIRLIARWSADVVQSCVVTLEPVASRLADTFEQVFAPPAVLEMLAGDRTLIDVEAADPPEPLFGDSIDVGEALAEQVALSLDPYPRAPGAELPAAYAAGGEERGRREGPFAKLRDMSGTT